MPLSIWAIIYDTNINDVFNNLFKNLSLTQQVYISNLHKLINVNVIFRYTFKTLKYHHIYVFLMSTYVYHKINTLTVNKVKDIFLMKWSFFKKTNWDSLHHNHCPMILIKCVIMVSIEHNGLILTHCSHGATHHVLSLIVSLHNIQDRGKRCLESMLWKVMLD
jgi:hypothetical protein